MRSYCLGDRPCSYRSDTGYCVYTGNGCGLDDCTATVKVPDTPAYRLTQLVDISPESVENIADAVAEKLRKEVKVDCLPRDTGKLEVNWIYEFYQGIENGTYCVSKLTRLTYSKIVKGIETKEFFFDAKQANAAIEWIEMLAPESVLAVWQKALLSVMVGIVDGKGNRPFRWDQVVRGDIYDD